MTIAYLLTATVTTKTNKTVKFFKLDLYCTIEVRNSLKSII
ncbi:hypothetical protein ADIARSV_2178 [Arcticibacter svalbardensis MN12-7]|uniref:Uncharacterized protein n=1 Tax=Arcticibacter svalbardensis MN12-7 TaxID=1150600 RepID=R9GSQ5_9SPHI|nr:hypothetical protein ADIARSV_2178 [Arcticibacter svalbardensis MN12-7]